MVHLRSFFSRENKLQFIFLYPPCILPQNMIQYKIAKTIKFLGIQNPFFKKGFGRRRLAPPANSLRKDTPYA